MAWVVALQLYYVARETTSLLLLLQYPSMLAGHIGPHKCWKAEGCVMSRHGCAAMMHVEFAAQQDKAAAATVRVAQSHLKARRSKSQEA